MSNWCEDIKSYDHRRVYSQTNEDGIIKFIFENIGITNKFCVEFGAGNGSNLSNTRLLRDNGWDSLLLDAKPKKTDLFTIHSEFITAENINDLFAKYDVPQEFDLLSIDIDGNDYWVWKAITYKPRVVVIEFNPIWHPHECKTVKYNPDHVFDQTSYYGASIGAMRKLGTSKSMKLVYCNKLNAFFVQEELLPDNFKDIELSPKRQGGWPPDTLNREWVDV